MSKQHIEELKANINVLTFDAQEDKMQALDHAMSFFLNEQYKEAAQELKDCCDGDTLWDEDCYRLAKQIEKLDS